MMEFAPLDQWVRTHAPSTDMYYHAAYHAQVAAWERLGQRLEGKSPRVVGTHTSKSILLPVVGLALPQGSMYLRDNFYDVNVCVVSEKPLVVPLADLYRAMSWEDYCAEITRAEGYSWKGWTKEEIDDPRILRVQVHGPAGGSYWSTKSGEEKDHWVCRFESTAWYTRWSGAELLIDGRMGPGCTFYRAGRAFAEGISGLVEPDALQPYRPPSSARFAVCTTRDRVDAVLDAIFAAGAA